MFYKHVLLFLAKLSMRFILALLTFCSLILFSTQSCQKDTDPPVTDTLIISHTDTLFHSDTVYVKEPLSILGLWIGTYDVTKGTDAGRKDFYYSFELHTDSTIQVISTGDDGMTYYGIGSWKLKSTSFSAHITTTNLSTAGVPQTITATYDSAHNKLTGIVTDDNYSDYEASFNLEKVQ